MQLIIAIGICILLFNIQEYLRYKITWGCPYCLAFWITTILSILCILFINIHTISVVLFLYSSYQAGRTYRENKKQPKNNMFI